MKGQQEIVGLLIIIIILVFAVLFFFTLSFKTPSLPTIKEVTKATSVLNIISKVNLCDQVSLEEAVKSCSKSINACNKNACELVKEETEKMLKQLLRPKESFNMSISQENKNILEFGNCKGDTITTSRKIPLEFAIIDVKLFICKE
ncbi:hypothetical protein HY498_05255 [Candidatus Woesearchaeota archaeon]|nr:hypothetical protein [Candidatus Woesearchaeota archaeon]